MGLPFCTALDSAVHGRLIQYRPWPRAAAVAPVIRLVIMAHVLSKTLFV